MNTSINRNDLEEFQRNLLKKINARIYSQRELEPIPEDNFIPGTGSNILEEVDTLSNSSQSMENNLSSLRIIRQRSNNSSFSNTGYLFLAVVFCMMCCSSLIMSPSNAIKYAS